MSDRVSTDYMNRNQGNFGFLQAPGKNKGIVNYANRGAPESTSASRRFSYGQVFESLDDESGVNQLAGLSLSKRNRALQAEGAAANSASLRFSYSAVFENQDGIEAPMQENAIAGMNANMKNSKGEEERTLTSSASSKFSYGNVFDAVGKEDLSNENTQVEKLSQIREDEEFDEDTNTFSDDLRKANKMKSSPKKRLSLSDQTFGRVYGTNGQSSNENLLEEENVYKDQLHNLNESKLGPEDATSLKHSASSYIEAGDVFEEHDIVSGNKALGNHLESSGKKGKNPAQQVSHGMFQFIHMSAEEMVTNKPPDWLQLLKDRVASKLKKDGSASQDVDELMKREEELMYQELKVARRISMLNKHQAKPFFPNDFHARLAAHAGETKTQTHS